MNKMELNEAFHCIVFDHLAIMFSEGFFLDQQGKASHYGDGWDMDGAGQTRSKLRGNSLP
jgi:hypothetical protein